MTIAAACAAVPLGVATTGAAQAQIAYVACKEDVNFACAHVKAPLDPSGVLPGTVSLSLRRHRAPIGESHSAIVALAGGPGQAAVPLAEDFTELLGTIAAGRDVIAFDQRGTGKSGPLKCKAFSRAGFSRSLRRAVAACATQLGRARAFYRTADTVADIEAIREAGGYEKLVLYGTSYGTKVAEEYAATYPEHVEALVLDSVVPPAGPDPLNRSTFAAIPRVLSQMCAQRSCAGIGSSPVRDLARLLASAAHSRTGAVRTTALSPRGKPKPVLVRPSGIFELLLDGDFSPLLRAQLVTDLAASAHGDDAPLARLYAPIAEAEPEAPNSDEFDLPLYYATECEELSFRFDRSAPPATRLREARAAAAALPPETFAPFSARTAFGESDIPACSAWPYPPASAPAAAGTLPDVPTLILSGADDLRTPTSNAREVAAAIPDAKLLVVPDTGHSVLGSEPSPCAGDALKAFFAARAIKACKASRPPALLRPGAPPPRRLGQLRPAHGYHGLAGRTLTAVEATMRDLGIQLYLSVLNGSALEQLLSRSRLDLPGLRTGWAQFDRSGTIDFHDYSYVPGVTLSGTIRTETGDLRIGGSAGAHGTLRPAAHHSLVGRLAGVRVQLSSSPFASAAIVGEHATPSETLDPRHPGRRRVPDDLARVVRWLVDL